MHVYAHKHTHTLIITRYKIYNYACSIVSCYFSYKYCLLLVVNRLVIIYECFAGHCTRDTLPCGGGR